MAASRIKGITVEINGDTTGLNKALENVNKNIRSTQSQLKDVEKLLKLDPGNTELLAQKQKLLADAVSETKEKLATLGDNISKVKDAVSNVAETIKSYLHFSVPDEGPLTDFEDWMPDFMEGLADGIEKSRSLIRGAVSDVAGDMVISPQAASMQGDGGSGGSSAAADSSLSGILSGIREMAESLGGQSGDIVIPVYLGGTMLDEVIVNAQQRANLRSGGR